MEVTLYDSTFCRLCGEENENGVFLYTQDDTEPDLCSLINKYLPCKVQDDGKLPRTICPGCNIQLHATVQFFDLLVEGQKKIRDLWKNQIELLRKPEKGKNLDENRIIFFATPDDKQNSTQENEVSCSVGVPSFDSGIVLQILEDGTLFASEHELSLKMDGLEKPRKRRGRPPKRTVETAEEPATPAEPPSQQEQEKAKEDEEEEELDADGRKRRKRKVPQRFKEALQGKELDKLLLEEGIINEDDQDDEVSDADDDDVEESMIKPDVDEEVIGHLESSEGQDLGELVIVNHSRKKSKPRGGRRRKINYQCDICGKGFQHRGRYKMHKSFHKGVRFECGTCSERFPSREALYEHQKSGDHKGEGIIEGVGDMPEQDSDNRIHCTQCDKSFQTKQSYEVHVKAIHEGCKPFVCEVCGKKFAYPNSLKCHVWATHEDSKDDKDKKYACDECDKRFNHPSSVVYHKEAHHNNGRRFVCNKCGKGFKHRQLLQRHQLVHSENRPYECKLCGATFKTKANLINHQPTHTGEKKYSCEMCGQQFAHKTSLSLHYRWHTGLKPFTCEVCKKSFSQNGNLQEHMRIHTGEKPFGCDYCGRRFTTSSQARLHLKRHTGERPWKCEFCSKTFLHKDTWKCHTRRHRGERPYECVFCSRGFTEQWALKKHVRLHTGEKPYSCNFCGKTFADCSNLTKHKKIHREGFSNNGMWDIIKNHLSCDVADQESGKSDTGEVQQIIYVTYQDPDDPEGKTLHIMDERPSNKVTQVSKQSVTTEITELRDDQELALEQVSSSHPLEVMDEDGNPIQFAMADGRQLHLTTTDGQSLQVTTLDGHTYPVQLATLDGQVITDVSNQLPGVPVTEEADTSHMQVQNITEDLQESTQEMGVNIDDLTESSEQEHALEFVTEDGQKVRLLTSYNLDSFTTGHDYFAQSSQLAQ